jgi:hypothetical protein
LYAPTRPDHDPDSNDADDEHQSRRKEYGRVEHAPRLAKEPDLKDGKRGERDGQHDDEDSQGGLRGARRLIDSLLLGPDERREGRESLVLNQA